MFIQQNPIDPTLPASVPPADLTNWPDMLNQVLDNLFTPATPPLLALGNNLWTGLAVIIVAWTGFRIAFAGAGFNFWTIIQMVTGLMIPLAMLRFYDSPFLGVAALPPFPNIIPAGANQIADLFRADSITEMTQGLQRLDEAFNQNIAGAEHWLQKVHAWLENPFVRFQLWLKHKGIMVMFCIIFAIALAQVFWAQIAIAILIFLGPAFIPWLVFKPMAFLFWGWFRAMWTYSLYAIIAAAMLRIWTSIGLTTLNSFVNDALSYVDPASAIPTVHTVAIIPLVAAAVLSCMKIPEIAGAIGGASVSGGGMAGLVTGAMTMGMSRISRIAGAGK
ncbi:MAG: type IV secretion system protein [Gemmatimonadota bacterium]|nr:type IV secretion system protein [Gemmatimonadota bacterium]